VVALIKRAAQHSSRTITGITLPLRSASGTVVALLQGTLAPARSAGECNAPDGWDSARFEHVSGFGLALFRRRVHAPTPRSYPVAITRGKSHTVGQ
jgi:hypothetical protein